MRIGPMWLLRAAQRAHANDSECGGSSLGGSARDHVTRRAGAQTLRAA